MHEKLGKNVTTNGRVDIPLYPAAVIGHDFCTYRDLGEIAFELTSTEPWPHGKASLTVEAERELRIRTEAKRGNAVLWPQFTPRTVIVGEPAKRRISFHVTGRAARLRPDIAELVSIRARRLKAEAKLGIKRGRGEELPWT